MKTILLVSLIPLTAALAAQTASQADALTRAEAALQNNNLAAAEALLVPLASGETPAAAACHQLGFVRQRQGRAADAIALHEQATKLDPTNAAYFSALGGVLGQRMSELPFMRQAMLAGRLRNAFAKSVELDPNHVPGLLGLSRFYRNAPEIAGGSRDKAVELAERAAAINPFLGALELAGIAEHHEDFAVALGHYETAAQRHSGSVTAHAGAGRMLAKLGRTEEARTRLQQALALDPQRESTRKALASLPAPR